jgi:hypothetical protein
MTKLQMMTVNVRPDGSFEFHPHEPAFKYEVAPT